MKEKQMDWFFSVNDGVKIPPSLRNIFRELNDLEQLFMPTSGNLENGQSKVYYCWMRV
jgi:uracil DNA glycosylase